MTESETLHAFIAAAKAKGLADEFIVSLLRQNGWSERRIYAAFTAYYQDVLDAPLPSRGGRTEYASDAFLYLLAFISLGFWTVALGHLFFVLIDRWFPSGLDTSYVVTSFRQSVTSELATLIVAFPIYFFVSRSIQRGLASRPESAESGVRKWLTYLALVVTAVILLGDAIWFLATFLQGDLTVRFVLKALVLLAIAGGIFAYYLSVMRTQPVLVQRDRGFGAVALAAVLLGLAFGFLDIGTPAHARDVSADLRRVRDLSAIASAIHSHDQTKPPHKLDEVELMMGSKTDPITGRAYDYRPGAGPNYELCADFATEDRRKQLGAFVHPAGRMCFHLSSTRQYFTPIYF